VDDLGLGRDRAPPRLEAGKAGQLVGFQCQNLFSFWIRALAPAAIGASSSTMDTAMAAVLPIVASYERGRDGVAHYSRLA
jgi:hypothetical protein